MKKIIKKYHKAILDMRKLSKRLGYETDIVEEAGNNASLYMMKTTDDISKILRVPLDIKKKKDIIYYEYAREELEKQSFIKKKEETLAIIIQRIEDAKKQAEAEVVSTLNIDEFNIYYDWAINRKKQKTKDNQ